MMFIMIIELFGYNGANDEIAKVGFIDNFEEKDVFIKDLYERNLGD